MITINKNELDRITNRHVGRLLSKIEQIHDISDFAKEGIRSEMHYLKEDLIESMEAEANGNKTRS